MSKVVKAEIEGVITMTDGVVRDTPVLATFEYEEDYPLEYTILFCWNEDDEHVECLWDIGRPLFTEALREGCAGGQDVAVIDCGKDMAIALLTDEGSCTILLDMGQVVRFINRTTRLVPEGEENVEGQVDRFLAGVFE